MRTWSRSTTVCPWRHDLTTAAPSRGQARRRRAQVLQHHHGEAHSPVTAFGSPTNGESLWIRTAMRAGELGARRNGGETQIDADQMVRRRMAVRLAPISSPELAGDGRNNSATATRVARAR